MGVGGRPPCGPRHPRLRLCPTTNRTATRTITASEPLRRILVGPGVGQEGRVIATDERTIWRSSVRERQVLSPFDFARVRVSAPVTLFLRWASRMRVC
jgi:hypothetical protein